MSPFEIGFVHSIPPKFIQVVVSVVHAFLLLSSMPRYKGAGFKWTTQT